ncbi:hypothetical protein IFR05_015621 [Cadophora sp. M221]|nr:hypothetical protein IFR05_015621 [Cadophora sp. M221]
MATVLLLGSTGLVGSIILNSLSSSAAISSIYTIARRAPQVPHTKITPIIEADSSQWPEKVAPISPTPSLFISALGTSKAQAGSIENQRKIDFDLNLAVAKAAKAAGIKVYVLISAAGISTTSHFAYPKMKAELEEAIKEVGFKKTVFIKPGMIVGTRENAKPLDGIVRGAAWFSGVISGGHLKDIWAQDAEYIGRAAIVAGLEAVAGEGPAVRNVGHEDIVKLGKHSAAAPA